MPVRARLLPLILLFALAFPFAACGDDDGGGALTAPAATQRSASEGARDANLDDSAVTNTIAGSGDGAQSEPGFDTQALSTNRKIIYTANLRLEAEDVQATFAAVEQAARAAAGFVQTSSIGSFTDGEGREYATATITIRIPVDRYDSTLATIRSIPGSTVKSEDSSATEVTEEYTDLESGLRNLERSESQYLTLLEDAHTIQDILTVNERIDSVRSQIEQIQGRLRLLDDLIDMATVAVSIQSPDTPAPPEDEGPKSFADAFRDTWNDAEEAGRYLLEAGAVVLVAAIWLAIPVLVVVAVALFFQRRSSRAGAPGGSPAPADGSIAEGEEPRP